MNADIHISRNGTPLGEFSQDEINRKIAEGSLDPTDHFWREGMVEWKSLAYFDFYVSKQTENTAIQNSPEPIRMAQTVEDKRNSEALGFAMLLLPVASSFLIFFAFPHRWPFGVLIISVCTILFTALLAAIEVAVIGSAFERERDENGNRPLKPIEWFFFILLLWIIGFPSYLSYRSRYKLRSYLGPSIVVALMFAALLFLI